MCGLRCVIFDIRAWPSGNSVERSHQDKGLEPNATIAQRGHNFYMKIKGIGQNQYVKQNMLLFYCLVLCLSVFWGEVS